MSADEKHLEPGTLEALRTGEATEADRVHLEGCAHCREELQAIEALAAGLTDGLEVPFEIPTVRDEAIRELARVRASEIREAKVVRPARWQRLRETVPSALVASLVVGVVGFVVLFRNASDLDLQKVATRSESSAAQEHFAELESKEQSFADRADPEFAAAPVAAPVDLLAVFDDDERRDADRGLEEAEDGEGLAESVAPEPAEAARKAAAKQAPMPSTKPVPESVLRRNVEPERAKSDVATMESASSPSLVLERTDLKVHVGAREQVRVEQRLRHSAAASDAPAAQARFRYPVSKDAQLSGPDVRVAGRIVEAELDVTKLEDEGERIVTTWNLPAVADDDEVEVSLAYSIPLEPDLRIHVLAVPLSWEALAGGVRISGQVSAAFPIAEVTSPSHTLHATREAPDRFRVEVEVPDEGGERDLVLHILRAY